MKHLVLVGQRGWSGRMREIFKFSECQLFTFLGSSALVLDATLNGFYRLRAQNAYFAPRTCLLGVWMMTFQMMGVISPKNRIFGGGNRTFQAK
jgi:hypothetical protein